MKNCIIIGGGIIGVCTAYYLHKEGHQVTVIDKSDFSKGASYINAGYITPSHFISLAAPGMISKGIKWMFNPASPFYIKPRLDSDFLRWVWAFKRSATKAKIERSIPVIKDINLLSRELYEELKRSKEFGFHYEHKGLLMCYQSDKVGEEEWKVGQRGIKEGLGVRKLDQKEVNELQSGAHLAIKGAIYYDCDAHMTPNNFMQEIITFLKGKGVTFYSNEEVLDIEMKNEIISKVVTSKQEIKADEFILASGSWSPNIAKKLGIKLLVQAGKGYNIDVKRETGISIPTILCEAKVAVTPMSGFTRFAGTMELGGINHKINKVRVNAIAKAAERYYSELAITTNEKDAAGCGLRPCSPDGLPFIGKSSKCKNLTIATGHAMMGWSLGPATGKLVSEVISNKKTSLDINPFHPDRKY